MTLTFDQAKHEYYWQGHKVPSVTKILGAMTNFDGIRESVLDYARGRGQAVHYATELYDRDDLDWDSLDPELRPYLEGWIKFRRENHFTPELIEHKVFHPQLKYAGMLDRAGVLFGDRAIVDIKATAQMYPTVGAQTAAYAEAYNAENPGAAPFTERYSVQLKKDGSYRLHHYTEKTDWPTFIAMRTVILWSERNKQRLSYDPAE